MNHSKIYVLPDGEEIDLSGIVSIGELQRVRSEEFKSLGYWSFTIIFKDGETIEIQEGYLYNYMSRAKIELQMIRDNILKSL